jgi:hypothetical protein
MDQPVGPHQPSPRSPLSRIVLILSVPLRLLALFVLLVMVIPGTVMMWRLPGLADDNKFDLSLLTLRVLDRERSTTPLVPLGYQPAIEKHMIDICPDITLAEAIFRDCTLRTYDTGVTSVERTTSADGSSAYLVRFGHGRTKTVPITTPHLNVPAKEVEKARKAMARIFRSKKRQAEIQEWGESLFWTEWLRIHPLYDVSYKQVPGPLGGTADERLWLAWTVLRGDNQTLEEELFRLPALFRETFKTEADRKAALAWAKELYDRLEANYRSYQEVVRSQPGHDPNSRGRICEILVSCKRVLPPRMNWTCYWLLYRYVGLSKASRAQALANWQRCFPEQKHEDVVKFGRKVLEDRKAAGEPLPPVPEVLPWLCAVERLVGSDPYGTRCHSLIDREYGKYQSMLENGIKVANPNDDMFFLGAANDPLRLYPTGMGGETWRGKVCRVGTAIFYIAIMLLGIGTLVRLGAWMFLSGRRLELWREHTEGRGKEPWWQWLVGVLIASALGALNAPNSLAEPMGLHLARYEEFFLGAVTATLVGGVLIGTCRRVLALVLVGLGVNVERTWLDEALGILLGGLILRHFGADVVTIGLFALSDVIPGLIQTVRSRLGRGAAEPSPVERDVPPAAVGAARMSSALWPSR